MVVAVVEPLFSAVELSLSDWTSAGSMFIGDSSSVPTVSARQTVVSLRFPHARQEAPVCERNGDNGRYLAPFRHLNRHRLRNRKVSEWRRRQPPTGAPASSLEIIVERVDSLAFEVVSNDLIKPSVLVSVERQSEDDPVSAVANSWTLMGEQSPSEKLQSVCVDLSNRRSLLTVCGAADCAQIRWLHLSLNSDAVYGESSWSRCRPTNYRCGTSCWRLLVRRQPSRSHWTQCRTVNATILFCFYHWWAQAVNSWENLCARDKSKVLFTNNNFAFRKIIICIRWFPKQFCFKVSYLGLKVEQHFIIFI